mmetsp:Transcript_46064/g.103463  ORF Transcript_46064/g.103463 Transcript_46064/m.103463 type:complete len:104 (-) Transcript_46064:46-357(-)
MKYLPKEWGETFDFSNNVVKHEFSVLWVGCIFMIFTYLPLTVFLFACVGAYPTTRRRNATTMQGQHTADLQDADDEEKSAVGGTSDLTHQDLNSEPSQTKLSI